MRRPSKGLRYILNVVSDDKLLESHLFRGLWRETRKDGSTWVKLTPHQQDTEDPNQMTLFNGDEHEQSKIHAQGIQSPLQGDRLQLEGERSSEVTKLG